MRRTELVKDELELREFWKEREGLRNILDKNPCEAPWSSSSDLANIDSRLRFILHLKAP